MNIIEEFINEFHNLEGIRLAEKRRNFFYLLHKYSSLHEDNTVLKAIASQLKAKTHLEKIFFIDFLIYFHCFDELCIQFVKRDEIVVSKVTKQKWFFERIFQENNADFVNIFLPTLSYNLRIKVLKKLVLILKEQQSDELFDALLDRYGVFIASNILPSCSCLKIEQVLRSYPIKLWTSQLKLLYYKMPDLMMIYFEERVKHEGNSKFLNWDPIVQFIAMKNPEMFCNLQEKYKLEYSRLGKRLTKKIILYKKQDIIAKPEVYVKNLKAACLVRKLGKDCEQIYLKLFPKNLDYVFSHYTEAATLLRHFPKKRQFTIFKNTFDQIFYNNLEESCASVDIHNYLYVLKMIACSEEREKWAQLKWGYDKNIQYVKYYKALTCINTIQPKLNVLGSITKRVEYVGTITESCLINKDWQALLTVCKLLCGILKHDHQKVHGKFLEVLTNRDYRQVFQNLSELHWSYITKIIKKAGDFNSSPLILKFIEFVCENELLIENEIIQLMKKSKWINCANDFKSKPKLEKKIILLLIRIAPQILDDDYTVEKADICLIRMCKSHALRYPEEKINIFDHGRLIQSLKDVLNGQHMIENYKLADVVDWVICAKNRNEELENLTELYWNNFEKLGTINVAIWFLRNKPDLVMKNVNKFVEIVALNKFCSEYCWYVSRQSKSTLWKIIKCYSYLQIEHKMLEYCLEKLNDNEFSEKSILAEPLSLMMSTDDFTKLVEKYKPSVTKVDLQKNDEKEKFQLQRWLLKSCVNVSEPEKILPTILEFCSGDYVASCISPLHSCLYKIPENRIKVFLDRLCNVGAVSVKKHGFYFVCMTQDEATIFDSLKMCRLSQSIAMTFQHFIKNPTNQSWELLKEKLLHLDNNDHFTCLLLVNRPVPKMYKSQYFEVAYEVFRNKQNRFKNVLIDKLHEETIGHINSQFFNMPGNNFFAIKRSDTLLAYYLLYCPENKKIDVLFNILQTFKQQQWSFRSHEARERINQFIMSLAMVYLEREIVDLPLVKSFAEGFQNIFPPVEVFEEFIILSLIQFKNLDVADLVTSVLHLHNDLISRFGNPVFAIFASCLNKILKKIFPEDNRQLEFYCSLLAAQKSVEDILLVIYLLPRGRPQFKESVHLYNKALDLLRENKNETVQLHLHLQIE